MKLSTAKNKRFCTTEWSWFRKNGQGNRALLGDVDGREVIKADDTPAVDVAEWLHLSVPAVKSALQRAKAHARYILFYHLLTAGFFACCRWSRRSPARPPTKG